MKRDDLKRLIKLLRSLLPPFDKWCRLQSPEAKRLLFSVWLEAMADISYEEGEGVARGIVTGDIPANREWSFGNELELLIAFVRNEVVKRRKEAAAAEFEEEQKRQAEESAECYRNARQCPERGGPMSIGEMFRERLRRNSDE